jgi:hypothetical protein
LCSICPKFLWVYRLLRTSNQTQRL